MESGHSRYAEEQAGLPGLLAGFALDYLRWLALVPMVFSWAALVLVVVLMLAVNFQGGIDRMLERAEPWVEPWAERWLGPVDDEGVGEVGEEAAEPLVLTEQDFKPWVYRIWMFAALAGYLLGLLRGWLFGPREPAPLKRKILRAGMAAAVCSALLFMAWLFGSETYAGPALGWVLMFTLFPLLVWAISAGGLSVSALLDRARSVIIPAVDGLALAAIRRARPGSGLD